MTGSQKIVRAHANIAIISKKEDGVLRVKEESVGQMRVSHVGQKKMLVIKRGTGAWVRR